MGPNTAASESAILGILSLIIWALILIVTVKYVIILLRADNNGEGGTLALMALANRTLGGRSALIVVLGMKQKRRRLTDCAPRCGIDRNSRIACRS